MLHRLLAGFILSALFGLAIASSPTTAAAPVVIQTDMYGTNQVPSVETNAWGFFRFFFSEDRSYANVTVDVKGISGPSVIGADIHVGAPGTNGPILKHVSDGGFIVTGERVTFSESDLRAMANGELYVSLKTLDHPDGALRGQIQVPAGFLPGNTGTTPPPVSTATAVPGSTSVPVATGTSQPEATITVPTRAPSSGGPITPPNTGDAGLR